MVYIDHFTFADIEKEENFLFAQQRTCYDTYYPFMLFPNKEFERIDFEDITILYGGNGSGKTTALNLIANKIDAERRTVYNRSNFFEDYLKLCRIKFADKTYKNKAILTSDDVFDYMIDLRYLNQNIDNRRDEAIDTYYEYRMTKKYPHGNDYFMPKREVQDRMDYIHQNPLENFEEYKRIQMILRKKSTQSQYTKMTTIKNIRELSNGESAFNYFVNTIDNNGIYILDEPENSLAPHLQLELVKFLKDSARFYNCQFIIATHSPFILSIENAKIYDLDATPVDIKKWSELESIKEYYKLFKEHEGEFCQNNGSCLLKDSDIESSTHKTECVFDGKNDGEQYIKDDVNENDDSELTTKAKMLIEWLIRLQLPEEKVEGMLSMLTTDEQIDELMYWVKKNPVQFTIEWKKDLMAQAVTIATGR